MNITNGKIPRFNYGISAVYNNPGIEDIVVVEDILPISANKETHSPTLVNMNEIVTPTPYSVFALCKLSFFSQYN